MLQKLAKFFFFNEILRVNAFLIGIVYILTLKKWSNKDLLYSTGNSIQYSVMIYVRKESKKEWTYI